MADSASRPASQPCLTIEAALLSLHSKLWLQLRLSNYDDDGNVTAFSTLRIVFNRVLQFFSKFYVQLVTRIICILMDDKKGICKGDFSTAKSSDQSAHKLKSENKIFRTTEHWVLDCTVGYFSRNQLHASNISLSQFWINYWTQWYKI